MSNYGKNTMSLLRASDVAPTIGRGRGKHHTSNYGSEIAMKRRIQKQLSLKRGTTKFGDSLGGYATFGSGKNPTAVHNKTGLHNKTSKAANKGTQGEYLYFKRLLGGNVKVAGN